MSFTIPDSSEIIKIANELDMSLGEKEATEFKNYLKGFEEGYRYLEQPADLPGVGNMPREYHWPEREDNPCNAWYVKSAIKAISQLDNSALSPIASGQILHLK